MEGDRSARANGPAQRCDTGLSVPDLAEDTHQHGDIEVTVPEGESRPRVHDSVRDLASRARIEFPLCLGEHLRLKIHQVKHSPRYSPRQLDAEVTGTRAHFEHSLSAAELQAPDQLLWRNDDPARRIVDQPRELVGKNSARPERARQNDCQRAATSWLSRAVLPPDHLDRRDPGERQDWPRRQTPSPVDSMPS